jgi:hypothetical protein
LRENADDIMDISNALRSVNEEFGMHCCDGAGWILVHTLRNRTLFGGLMECILEDDTDTEKLAT